MEPRNVLLCASYSTIEPLGLFHLAAVAKEEGWRPRIVLGREPNFREITDAVDEHNPELLGFTVYTGNHVPVFRLLDILRKRDGLEVAIGGPHPTAFPEQALAHADYVVPSEGFEPFRRILRGEAQRGIVSPRHLEKFPIAERKQFYADSKVHGQSRIKNVITQTGCPHSCTYCYNSLRLADIAGVLAPDQAAAMEQALASSDGRLFPKSVRSVDDVVIEIEDIQRLAPETRIIFFQDDTFGWDINWLREFRVKYNARLPFHAMTRFELFNPATAKGRERAELMREAGCSGLTFAIESADSIIRNEVLNRRMNEEIMFSAMRLVGKMGFTARTFSMMGLPYGATATPTDVNLEQDLKTLALNVRLMEETGLPTVAWASILVPYPKTVIDAYCARHGFYTGNHDDILKGSYRADSVLRFAKHWVGPSLSRDMPDVWLEEDERGFYKAQLSQLMNYFPLFARMPKGDLLARRFLEAGDLTPWGLNNAIRYHLYEHELYMVSDD